MNNLVLCKYKDGGAGLTADLDHDIVDGAPAARFIERFRNLIERGEASRE